MNIYGIDLDGVFIPDIHDDHYKNDWDTALKMRYELKPYCRTTLPLIEPEKKFIIISARFESDRELTEKWLAEHGIDYDRLALRKNHEGGKKYYDNHVGKNERAAVSKAENIILHGVTHFYESEPLQAMMISSKVPHVKVFCWNNEFDIRFSVSSGKIEK